MTFKGGFNGSKTGLSEELIGMRAVQEIKEGYCVNLGRGLPGVVPNCIPQGMEVMLHSESGVLGYGPLPEEEMWDADLVIAGISPGSLLPGASFFDDADAHLMMRAGHLDLTFLGAYQVSEEGDLANWSLGRPDELGNIGGAMDLAQGAKRVIVLMNHVDRTGKPRILKHCSYPLTGKKVVNKVITSLAVIEVTPQGLLLKEVAPGFTTEEIQTVTEPKLIVAADLKEMEF
ncbi:3-oxoacid CoA-transferase subunit B [Chloroflexota bacterium]